MQEYVAVIGTGTSTAPPDQCLVFISVEARARHVAEAVASCSERSRTMLASLEALVDPEALQTSSVQVGEHWGDRGRREGFVAAQSTTVTVDDVDRVGEVLGAAADPAGDTLRVRSLRWGHRPETRAALESQAREAAWRHALAQAEQLAGLAERDLGPVLRISQPEDEWSVGEVVPASFRSMDAEAEMPVRAGQLDVRLTLAVRWALA